jgi:predicted metal-binding membrane protein/DNA-binding MarR family transcriptional regulator
MRRFSDAVAEAVFAALAEPTRRSILSSLAARGPATATDLAGLLPISRQAITKHLELLAASGLTEPGERRRIRYRVNAAPMTVARSYLAALARDWDSKLDRLQRSLDVLAPEPAAARTRPDDLARTRWMEDLMELLKGVRDSASQATGAGTWAPTAAALTVTLGLAAASWVVAIRQMNGMDMGVATRLGSFAFFAVLWVWMMAAMMLPGAAPAVLRRAHASGGVRAVPLFVASYLAVWVLVGVAVYALYRPHGYAAAGAVVIAAGAYELTPVKRYFRRRCRESVRTGYAFGLYCVGSSIGLMLLLVALSIMSIAWMAVIAVLVVAQKLLPAKAALDVPLALAIVGLGILIIIEPSSVPGITPPM